MVEISRQMMSPKVYKDIYILTEERFLDFWRLIRDWLEITGVWGWSWSKVSMELK